MPELEISADVIQSIRDRGLHPTGLQDLPVIEHGFTHFVLRAYPVAVEVEVEVQGGALDHAGQTAAQGQWLDLAEVTSKALPKPVAELLRSLRR